MLDSICLESLETTSVRLKLNKVKEPYSVERILETNVRVYEDISYNIRFDPSDEISSVEVFLNGEKVDNSVYRDGNVFFHGDDSYIFRGSLGLVQISLLISDNAGTNKWYYSDYVSVLVKSTYTNNTVDAMLKYVYENQDDILYRESSVTNVGVDRSIEYTDFWSQIVLLEDIASIYEENYGFFMANSRYKLEKTEVLDRVEKLQYVDSKTIQYIVQHPEYLHEEIDGIHYGRQRFLPTKTLTTQNFITKNIYENQIVVSFIELIDEEVKRLIKAIRRYLDILDIGEEREDGYIVSSFLLYVNATESLKIFENRFSDLEKKFHQLRNSYKHILSVDSIKLYGNPEPSAIFMNIPQYNRVYMCILRWFSRRGYDFAKERMMLTFFDASSIYESYVLIKMINHFRSMGYQLSESKSVFYPKQPGWRYKNKNCNNTFIFTTEDSDITLYYEPIIYDEDMSSINNIGLYRNNSVSLNAENEDERQGHYYVPDFLIKVHKANKDTYYICDAKFTRLNKVQYRDVPNLSYKYITSISTIDNLSEVKGLYVFYGIIDNKVGIQSFYDNMIGTNSIYPRIEMVPLSEDVPYNIQDKSFNEIIGGK